MNKKTRHRIQRMQVNCKYQRKTYERNVVAPLPKFQWSKIAAYDWKVGYNIGENSKVFLHSILKTLRGNQVAL